MDKTFRSWAALVGAAVCIAVPASAVPTLVSGTEVPPCDVLAIPSTVLDELGTAPPFPVGEQISAIAATTTATACASIPDDPQVANVLLSITNLNTIAFSDVWYVADYDTVISNFDGLVLGPGAFLIDAVGVNTPLVSEVGGSIAGVFEPGETWNFILQDYVNTFSLSAALINTIGLPSAGLGSSGSIVALPVPIPEPTPAALVALGLLGLATTRRRAA